MRGSFDDREASHEIVGGGDTGFGEINLTESIRDILRAKWTFVCALLLAVIFAIVSVAMATPEYTAAEVIGPQENSANSGMGGIASKYSGVASTLGLDIGGNNTTDFTLFQQVLVSQRLADELFQNASLKPLWFGPTWQKRPNNLTFLIKDWLKGILGLPKWTLPQPFALRAKLNSILSIVPDKRTGYVTVRATGSSPAEAELILREITEAADNIQRDSAKQRSLERIQYLGSKLKAVTSEDLRQSVIAILSVQEQHLMMASVDRDYAIQVIDPPAANPNPTSPNSRAILLVDLFYAFLAVCAAALVHGHRRRRSEATDPESVREFWSEGIDAANAKIIRTAVGKLRSASWPRGVFAWVRRP